MGSADNTPILVLRSNQTAVSFRTTHSTVPLYTVHFLYTVPIMFKVFKARKVGVTRTTQPTHKSVTSGWDLLSKYLTCLQNTTQSPSMESTTVLSPQWHLVNDRERNTKSFSSNKNVHKGEGRTGHFLSHGRLD